MQLKSFLKLILSNKYLPFLICIPLFFCLQRYSGIIWDAVLYLLQVVHSVDPARFVDDPPFMFGNQDSLGLFTPIYKIFIDLFGIANGTKYLCFTGQFGLAVALIWLIRSICVKERNTCWVLPIVLIYMGLIAYHMPNTMTFFVRFVQQYNCSRLLSLAFGVAGFAILFKEKKWLSLVLFLIGTVVHPLTAGWGLPVWFFVYYPKFRLPILVFSFLFPFSFLLHHSPLDLLPPDWMGRPVPHTPYLNV